MQDKNAHTIHLASDHSIPSPETVLMTSSGLQMWTVSDNCTSAGTFDKDTTVGINASVDPLKIPIVVCIFLQIPSFGQNAKKQEKLLSIHFHFELATTKHHRKPIQRGVS